MLHSAAKRYANDVRTGHFQKKAAVANAENIVGGKAGAVSEADAVSDTHLINALSNTAGGRRPDGANLALAQKFRDNSKVLKQTLRLRQTVRVYNRTEKTHKVLWLLKFGRDDVFGILGRHGKGQKRRRNVEVLKRAGHRVLAADGGHA